MALGLIGMSIPVFWLGTVANLFTQDRWHDTFLFSWVPPLGYTPLTEDPVLWFKHLVIPWITLSILYIGFYSRVLRSALIEAEGQDFVRTARAKGISERRVLVRHSLRTSMIGYVSLFGLDLGALTDAALVPVGLRGIDVAVADRDSVLDRLGSPSSSMNQVPRPSRGICTSLDSVYVSLRTIGQYSFSCVVGSHTPSALNAV